MLRFCFLVLDWILGPCTGPVPGWYPAWKIVQWDWAPIYIKVVWDIRTYICAICKFWSASYTISLLYVFASYRLDMAWPLANYSGTYDLTGVKGGPLTLTTQQFWWDPKMSMTWGADRGELSREAARIKWFEFGEFQPQQPRDDRSIRFPKVPYNFIKFHKISYSSIYSSQSQPEEFGRWMVNLLPWPTVFVMGSHGHVVMVAPGFLLKHDINEGEV